jgi:hypothetical protein
MQIFVDEVAVLSFFAFALLVEPAQSSDLLVVLHLGVLMFFARGLCPTFRRFFVPCLLCLVGLFLLFFFFV